MYFWQKKNITNKGTIINLTISGINALTINGTKFQIIKKCYQSLERLVDIN